MNRPKTISFNTMLRYVFRMFITLIIGIASLELGAETISDVVAAPEWSVKCNMRHNDDGADDRISSISFGDEYIVVWVTLKPCYNKSRMNFWWSRSTKLVIGGKTFPLVGHWQNSEGLYHSCDENGKVIGRGWSEVKSGESYNYNMVFRGRYKGEDETFSIIDNDTGDRSKSFGGSFNNVRIVPIENPIYDKMTDEALKDVILGDGGIAGIYQSVGDRSWKLGCFKNSNGAYVFVHLNNENHPWWRQFELKGTLQTTATPGTCMCDFYDEHKNLIKGCIALFNGGTLTITGSKNLDYDQNKLLFIKLFPGAENSSEKKNPSTSGAAYVPDSSGSGFPLKGGYIVTNYHVINGMSRIDVYLEGARSSASLACADKKNDVCILKTSLDTDNLPYALSSRKMDVGDKIYALGFPLTDTMGKNVKLTDGIINSLTGYEDDETLYQISAAVQPGNSGGPLFNEKGEVVGIVSAKHAGAENVNYAIKISYLKVMLENHGLEGAMPSRKFSLNSFLDRVDSLRKYVCRIDCCK